VEVLSAAIAPDGGRLALRVLNARHAERRSQVLVLRDLATGVDERLLAAGDGQPLHAIGPAAWSPGDGRLALCGYGINARQPATVYLLDAADGALTPLVRLAGAPPGPDCTPSWSPDGRFLVVEDGGELRVVEVASGRSATIGRGRQPAWGIPLSGR
jgi:Tol biopolymer transport system component